MYLKILISPLIFLAFLSSLCFCDDIRGEAENIMSAFEEKCMRKAITGDTVRRILENCVGNNLSSASSTIPASLYPTKFRQILQQCFSSPIPNFCAPSAQANARTCVIRNGISSLPELKRIYEQHRTAVMALASKISSECSAAIRAL